MSDYAARAPSPKPVFRAVTYADVFDALRAGWHDFTRAPLKAATFGAVYAICGGVIFWLLVAYRAPWMIVPIAIGFPLVGPFLAAGTYEICRRLDADEPLQMRSIFGFMALQRRREFAWMAFVTLFIFWIWMYQARILIALFLEMQAFSSLSALAAAVMTSAEGLMMLAIGTCLGGVLAAVLFATTVIAMPLLVDRELDVVTAIVASWQVVLANLGPMLLWAVLIGGITLISMVPFFMGLIVVFPVLGFATWHLYTAIAIDPNEPTLSSGAVGGSQLH